MTFLLYKNAFLKIKKSFGRYLSLLVIVMVGVGIYTGIAASAPDILRVADSYFQSQKLMDFKISSADGLTEQDLRAIKQLSGVAAAVPTYSLDVLSGGEAVRVHAIETEVNTLSLTSGRMPETDAECVAGRGGYKLGDRVEITDGAAGKLRNTAFTVVGLADCVLYLSDDYGGTTVGNGKLSSFLFIGRDNFLLPAYTEIDVIAETGGAAAYSDAYKTLTAKVGGELSAVKGPRWYVEDRSAAVGYDSLGGDIRVVTAIASVLPLFFVLLAMLMTSNSMARMVAEERGELGTLTSLGYRDGKIVLTYLLYVWSASGLGAAIGFFAGCGLIPPLVYSNFSFLLPPLVLSFSGLTLGAALAVTLALMSLVTAIACSRELRRAPASLLRPLPTKHGQKILLERVGFLWKRLSFTWKVTMRNLFRYKKRAFMTVVGVAGCAALLLTAFGLRDSMDGVPRRQYGEIFRYDDMLTLKDGVAAIDKDLEALLDSGGITRPLLLRQSAYTCLQDGKTLDCFLVVPQDMALFDRYFHLESAAGRGTIALDSGGAVVTEQIAETYRLKKGDTITLRDSNNGGYSLTVSDVAENYASNYVYVNAALYQRVFGGAPGYNAIVSDSAGDETALAERLIGSGLIANVTFTADAAKGLRDMTQNLNGIVVLLTLVASLLAVVVLYNLTAINISERVREIATLKVLGFRDGETNAYIYREAAVLTLVSLGAGLVLGVFLHGFVLHVIETTGSVTLVPAINWPSYLAACALTLFFSALMQAVTYFTLKKVDMISSLKSVE